MAADTQPITNEAKNAILTQLKEDIQMVETLVASQLSVVNVNVDCDKTQLIKGLLRLRKIYSDSELPYPTAVARLYDPLEECAENDFLIYLKRTTEQMHCQIAHKFYSVIEAVAFSLGFGKADVSRLEEQVYKDML